MYSEQNHCQRQKSKCGMLHAMFSITQSRRKHEIYDICLVRGGIIEECEQLTWKVLDWERRATPCEGGEKNWFLLEMPAWKYC